MKEIYGIITVTPLQLRIASEVVRVERIENFLLVNINAHNSLTLKSEYVKLSSRSISSKYIVANQSGARNLWETRQVSLAWREMNVSRIMLASIDNLLVQYIVSKINPKKILTFDDGSVNIRPSGIYQSPLAKPLKKKIKHHLIRGGFDQKHIVNSSSKHFTIFDCTKNIVKDKKLYRINPFSTLDLYGESPNFSDYPITVFIGSPHASYHQVVETIDPDFYVPHPMEKNPPNVRELVRLDSIAEDYIFALLQKYSKVRLYSISSTTMLNISHDRLEKYCIRISEEAADYYNFAQKLGCIILSLDDLPIKC